MFEILATLLFGFVLCLLLLLLQIPKPIIKIIHKLKEKEKEIIELYDPNLIVIDQDLFKLGAKELFLSWKLRHIILIGNKIKYYSIPYHRNDIAVGEFDIKDCLVRKADVEECFNDAAKYTFIIYSKPSHKFVLVAPNEKEREKCIFLIEKQIDLHSKHVASQNKNTPIKHKSLSKSYPTVLAVGHANRFSGNMVSTFRRHNYTLEMEKWMSECNKEDSSVNSSSNDIAINTVAQIKPRPQSVFISSATDTAIVSNTKTRPQSVFISSDVDKNYQSLVNRTNSKSQTIDMNVANSATNITTNTNTHTSTSPITVGTTDTNTSFVEATVTSAAAADSLRVSDASKIVEQKEKDIDGTDSAIDTVSDSHADADADVGMNSISLSKDMPSSEASLGDASVKAVVPPLSRPVSVPVPVHVPIRRFSTHVGDVGVTATSVNATAAATVMDSDDESIHELDGETGVGETGEKRKSSYSEWEWELESEEGEGEGKLDRFWRDVVTPGEIENEIENEIEPNLNLNSNSNVIQMESSECSDITTNKEILPSQPSSYYLPITNYNKEYDEIATIYDKFLQTHGGEKERIVFTAPVGKKNPVGITYYRQLFLTNTPRIFYIEPKSMVLRGIMQWSLKEQLHVEMINKTTFALSIPGDFRIWKFIDTSNGAAVWAQNIQSILKQQLQVANNN